MALTHAEPRLAPLGNASFEASDPQPRALKRSHSYSGYAPHRLRLSLDDHLDDGSTSAPGSGASEAPSSPGKISSEVATQADSLDEESWPEPELWPDTDTDGEESYEWSPCRRRCAVARASAEAASEASPQMLATILPASAACYPEAAAAQCAPAVHLAPPPPHGHAGWAGAPPCVAAPRGAVGLPLAQVPLPVTAMIPRGPPGWFGGQCPPAARGVLADAAATAPGSADTLQSAIRAAESALAALEAADAEARPAGQSRRSPRPLPRGVTSLMVRGLPQELSQRDLLTEVHRSGFAVDFCYVPRDFASRKNRGHAFLNFVAHEAAAEFYRAWHGRPTCAGRPATGASGLDISVAALQGLAANMAKWDGPRARRVRNPDYRPFVLGGGAARAAGGR